MAQLLYNTKAMHNNTFTKISYQSTMDNFRRGEHSGSRAGAKTGSIAPNTESKIKTT
jgi:hypothetical protein